MILDKLVKHNLRKANKINTKKSIKSLVFSCDSKNESTATAPDNLEINYSRRLDASESAKQCVVQKESVDSNVNKEIRFNEINLQMISDNIYKQIFGDDESTKDKNIGKDISSIKRELEDFGIITKSLSNIPDVHISIPEFKGKNIEEHFKEIAREQVEPYLTIINNLLNKLPQVPQEFVLREGWTRYTDSGCEAVDYPKENGLIMDVEVCVKNGPLPVLASAVSPNAWYCWVSKYLVEETPSNLINKRLTPDTLIPLESSKDEDSSKLNEFQQMPKIVVGHNVSFDRTRIKEQYWLNRSGTRFLDTMSLHICVSGTSSYQRALLKSKDENEPTNHLNSVSSLNNLADVYKLYCKAQLDKEQRDVFISGELHEIKEQFQELMRYCISDVEATCKVLTKLFPMFLERFPHPATLAGMLELSTAYLPVSNNWKRYLEEAETTYEDLNIESKHCLAKRADEVCKLLIDGKYKEDPWMWDEDWSTSNIKLKKGYEKIYNKEKNEREKDESKKKLELDLKFKYLEETRAFLPKVMPCMPGYPNWYRKFCQKQVSRMTLFSRHQNITTSMLITPKLLNLTWNAYPLFHLKKHGWGYLLPEKSKTLDGNLICKKDSSLEKDALVNENTSDGEKIEAASNEMILKDLVESSKEKSSLSGNFANCYFVKLPHKNGTEFNVGNPLSKDFLDKFSENVLSGVNASAQRILEISKMSSYWKNNRDRILSQLVFWMDKKSGSANGRAGKSHYNFGAIIPQIVVSGTLTRRAVESTWLTASNAQSERIGSELRAMISAPPNYSVVGADVDSQELWIASIIGDAFLKSSKIQGASPFSWMTLIGNKSQGTDMHSVTAKAVGITRDEAKVINYARIYGAGQRFAQMLLKQFNPKMSEKEASLKSRKMFLITKGQKFYRLKERYVSERLVERLYSAREASRVALTLGRSREEVFERGRWLGGSESAMFNSLEEIAELATPSTPFLNSRLTRALEEASSKHLPTKINWVVQSSAVDFLHLLLVSMSWLMKEKARICLSFHDEVRYLVPSKYKYNAAVAMHVSNLLVRSFFVARLGMKDLPMSVAFFTSVEVDSILRKEAKQDCKTPSNPHGLREGYGIPFGESLSIYDAVEKSKGCVGVLSFNLKNNE